MSSKYKTEVVIFVDESGHVDAYLRREYPEFGRVVYKALRPYIIKTPRQSSTLLSWTQTFISILVSLFS